MLIKEKDFNGFINGHEKDFDVIFRQYYKTLVSFAMRYELSGMEAEDVVIEVMHHIWDVRKDIKSPAALHSLFFIAVKNKTLNVIRNGKKHERIIRERKRESEEDVFYDHLMEEEMSRILDQAVAELPPQCSHVILALLNGKSVSEIALEMEISVNSVKTYKLRAIHILRNVLRDYSFLLWLFLLRLNY